ncbi:U11/U12 small nuclear ribonucleoprotein 65 kDa protein-like [Pyrus x bretschneideri]|uniref:U11/U12 small nuclear ribonucleoprotein 65 kDa protein-like n=1 Tax=Pyrus x bretschneideri TaxID=225117 RepID=UPI00202E3DB4|nr:U11/U12 small nuclear ribonucleoprotein 65 kDa protein-like [Pyrus x bretschneideri]
MYLLNRMNIPAPFRMALPSPPLPLSVPVPLPPPPPLLAEKPRSTDLLSEESEMESSDEEVNDKSYSRASSGRKCLKREAIVGPAVDKDVAHEDVGLKSATLIPKEIPMIKKKKPIVQIKIAPNVVTNENKDDGITEDSEHLENESADINAFATAEELEKLPPEEILSLPMFKNYAAGNAALVLYIKNLAKDIVADNFYYIFGSLFGSIDAAKSGLSVKLMQVRDINFIIIEE